MNVNKDETALACIYGYVHFLTWFLFSLSLSANFIKLSLLL